MKRQRFVLSVVLLIVLTFGVMAQAATISYRFWDVNQQPAMEQIIAAFSKVRPDIKVEVELIPWGNYWSSLETAAAGSNLPDVFWLNAAGFEVYGGYGMLSPVDNSGMDMSGYAQSLINMYTLKGQLYGMPKDFDTIGLWYNKELFDKAGVAYPDENWTWDDLINAAVKLTDPATNTWGIAAYLDDQQVYYNSIWQAGGHILSPDRKTSGYTDPKTIEGLRFWVDLIHKHKASPTLQQMSDTSAHQLFEGGLLAMFTAGSWDAARFYRNEYTRSRVDVAPLPQGEKRGVTIHGLANVIAANTKEYEAANAFVQFLGSPEAHKIQAESGAVIPAWEGYTDLWVKAHPEFNTQIFIDQLPYTVPMPASFTSLRWSPIQVDELKLAWAGEKSIEDAAAAIAKKMNEILVEER